MSKKSLKLIMFFSGIAIGAAAFIGEHAEEIPFVMGFIAHDYCKASKAVKTLNEKRRIHPGDDGFNELADLMVDKMSDKFDVMANGIRMSKKDMLNVGIRVDQITLEPTIEVRGRPLDAHLRAFLSFARAGGNPVGEVDESEVLSELDEMKKPDVLRFCTLLFMLACAVEIVAFFMETSEKRLAGHEQKSRESNNQ